MGQVVRFKLGKEPPTKPRRVLRVAVLKVDTIADLQRKYRATSARAAAHNVAVGLYAHARSTAIH